MSEEETFFRAKTDDLFPQYVGVSSMGGAHTSWVTCPLCDSSIKLAPTWSARYSRHLNTHLGATNHTDVPAYLCAVRFDLETRECLIPLEDVPRAVARRLRGARG